MKYQRHLGRLMAIPILSVVLVLMLAHPASGQGNPVATLDPVQGLVQVHTAQAPADTWTTITSSITVEEGDTVRTDSLGMADLTFFEGVQSQILPNSQVTIGKFQVSQQQPSTYQVTLQVAVGDVHNQISQVLNAGSHYEVYTPAAAITVRGTNFWSSASWNGEAGVDTLKGIVQIYGIDPNGQLTSPIFSNENQSVAIAKDGQLSPPGPLADLPQYPPSAPLAPQTCGDGICQIGEDKLCAVDCQTFPTCGDKVCQLDQGENPVTCALDCVPTFRGFPVIDAETQTTQPSQPSQPCQVQTTRRDVSMRVGPGYNRGVRDFLPANQVFNVLGETQANDGSLWWQLQVPGVEQAWVDQKDVASTGDCSTVGEATAPPIVIPQPPKPPTAVPGQPTNTPAAMSIAFFADRYSINSGECVVIQWDVEGIKQVYYEGKGVTGHETRKECPYSGTTYTLKVITLDGQTIYKTIDIRVSYVG